MFKNQIEKRVMAAIKNRIERAQKEHDEEVEKMILEHESRIRELEAQHEQDKTQVLEKHVDSILQKIL